jgi:hypothetical protein
MSKMSNYLENLIIERHLRGGAFTPPATVYLALASGITAGGDGDPTAFSEVSTTSTGYGRQAITFGAASGGAASNSVAISFSPATADWASGSNLTHWAIYDASTGGNMLYWGTVPTPGTVLSGETFTVDVGNITVTLSGNWTTTFMNQILDATLRAQALPAPTIRVALLTAFTNDSTFTECPDSNYARLTTTWGASSNGQSLNAVDIAYAAMNAQQVITHVALFDAATAGNMSYRGPLAASKTVGAGKVLKFLSGQLSINAQ